MHWPDWLSDAARAGMASARNRIRASMMSELDRTGGPRSDAIRGQVLKAIARNRTPGYHFPGHFLGVRWPVIGTNEARLLLPDGPHLHDAHGHVDIVALAVFIDIALGTAVRLEDAYRERQATIYLQLQLTGIPARGDITACARPRGGAVGTRIDYSFSEATLETGGGTVCHATGTFARLDAPRGVALGPLPWQHDDVAPPLPDVKALTTPEREILERCDRALSLATDDVPFIRRFWGLGEAPSRPGESCVVVAPHIGNRVGHVHGGILLGLAAHSACEAAPARMRLSNASIWYAKPGVGGQLFVRSSLIHAGKTTALVSTEVRSTESDVVVKAMTQHVAARGR